ncbi:MAG TPA: class I SAM-dependent methyltransferase, partial [Chryseolinea sp.]|nr:class I SAM-dependent methyltransferase [Chryseolinea sp.]
EECKHTDEIPESVQQYPLQMYHYLAAMTAITGKSVLEVGSGRGGGAKYIAERFKPASYTGMDIANSAVVLANKIHVASNLKFIQGSAESMPIEDNSIDVVINVESCHAYGSVDNFLKEVRRVLKPGGHFLMVDFRNEENVENMSTLKTQLRKTGMELLREENITENVIRSIEAEDESKKERIKKLIPSRWQSLFGEFAGVVDSKFYQTLKHGSRLYYRFELRKEA